MLHQPRSMASTNWRNRQTPANTGPSEISSNLHTLKLTDRRQSRGGRPSGQLPIIDEDHGTTASTCEQTPYSAAERLASIGSKHHTAPCRDGRTLSTGGREQGFGPKSLTTSTVCNENAGGLPNVLITPSRSKRYNNASYAAPNGSETASGKGNVLQPQKLARHKFKPGMIIRCSMHEEDYMGTSRGADMALGSKFVSKSFAGNVFTKIRIMIVVARHENHYTAVPLYTHNGNGLSMKTADEKMEYVSVKDHRIKGNFTSQTENGVLSTGYLRPGTHILDPKSTAHVTYTIPRRYDLPVVYYGYLTEQATKQLVALCKRWALKEQKS